MAFVSALVFFLFAYKKERTAPPLHRSLSLSLSLLYVLSKGSSTRFWYRQKTKKKLSSRQQKRGGMVQMKCTSKHHKGDGTCLNSIRVKELREKATCSRMRISKCPFSYLPCTTAARFSEIRTIKWTLLLGKKRLPVEKRIQRTPQQQPGQ